MRHLLVFSVLFLGADFALCAAESNAVISPDGTRAVWIKEDRSGFWLAQRGAPGENWSARKEVSIRGVIHRPVFSPDGSKLAFENARGGYSTQGPDIWGTRAYTWGFIAVYNFIDEHISYVDPSFAQDLDPHWSGSDAISYTRRSEGQPDIQLTAAVAATATVQGAAAEHRALLETLLGTPLVTKFGAPSTASDLPTTIWIRTPAMPAPMAVSYFGRKATISVSPGSATAGGTCTRYRYTAAPCGCSPPERAR